MAVPVVVTVRCHSCQKFRDPRELISVANVETCLDCWEWHEQALKVLAGKPPRGCPECRRSHEDLLAESPTGEVEYVIAPKDGIYQLLCKACELPYALKRKELFVGTEHGEKVLKL